jgi:ABC-type branched-subunit amino acid transport system substrate-binding protein
VRRGTKGLGLVGVLAILGLCLQVAPTTATGRDAPTPGVTSSTIKVGITYADVSAIRNIINVDPGDYQVAYTTLFDQINAHGGINGRKVVPVFAAVDPLGPAGAANACTRLTEDDQVFAVVGYFLPADTTCYVDTHRTPIIGLSLSGSQAAQAKAPWFNPVISDSDLIPKEMAAFDEEGAFSGKKVAVVGTAADQTEVNEVLPALKKLKVHVAQTAINSVPTADTTAQTAQFGVIAEKLQTLGVNVVVAVGNAGEDWPAALQDNQSAYLPRTVATDYVDLLAYVENKSGYSAAVLKGAVTAGGYPPATVFWSDPAMKRCVATIQKAEPNAAINNPITATPTTPVTWTAPLTACQQVALFSAIVKAAGKTLNNRTFAKGGASLTHISIPGGGGTFDFGGGHNDGDGPAFVYAWSPSAKKLVLKTTTK